MRAAITGELKDLKTLLEEGGDVFNINTPIRGSLNLLMNACMGAQPEVVEFLIDKGAEVNIDCDSQTPLMYACKSAEDSERVTRVAKKLLEAGAAVRISTLYGDTPLIFASQAGHTQAVEMMVKQASLDATNNQTGNSAIFFAIEKNHRDIVKILLENGASINIANRKGYLPRAVAEMHGFEDILQLFPQLEEQYRIPDHYNTVTHYRDMVPGILGRTDVPPYFYRIEPMLVGMDAQLLHEEFAKHDVGLPQFLTMNRSRLAEAGVELPFMQKKIMAGLIDFHSHPWSRQSVPVSRAKRFDTFELYAMLAGDLQHFVVMRSGLIFLLNLDHDYEWPYPQQKQALQVIALLQSFREHLIDLKSCALAIKKRNPEERADEITAKRIQKLEKGRGRIRVATIKCSIALSVICLLGVVIKQRFFKK